MQLLCALNCMTFSYQVTCHCSATCCNNKFIIEWHEFHDFITNCNRSSLIRRYLLWMTLLQTPVHAGVIRYVLLWDWNRYNLMCAGDRYQLHKQLANRSTLTSMPIAGVGKGGGVLDKPVIEKTTPGRESEFDLRYGYWHLTRYSVLSLGIAREC